MNLGIYLLPLLGGALIGLSAAAMLFVCGRVLGVSGIFQGVLFAGRGEKIWRLCFLLGLISGGMILFWSYGLKFEPPSARSNLASLFGGLLVGFGASLGNGCTSGHGICGVGRLSLRSIFATALFMGSGMLAVYSLKYLVEAL